MSAQCATLCSAIIKQYYGETVQSVTDALFVSVSRTVPAIVKSTKLTRSEVTLALAILIKFRLVNFAPSQTSECLAEYSLKIENILNILRYPKYVHLVQTKFGSTGTSIIEELLRSGTQSASTVILKCFSSGDNKDKLATYRDTFANMVNSHYLIRIPVPKQINDSEQIPQLSIEAFDLFVLPIIDLSQLSQVKSGQAKETTDAGVFWTINFERLHQDFRDNVMTSAIEKKLGTSASECFKFMLHQMYERTDPWQQSYSNPFTFVEVKQIVEKKSNNLDLIKYIDQYVSLIAEDSMGFIRRTGDMGGGQYVVDMKKAFEELALCCAEHVITEKFGSKASRIFRVINMKKYIEQEDIQKEAMVPAKEAKLLTYKLFEEQFIQIKTIRKAGGGGTGPAKSFYLFHVNAAQIMKMVLDICYKAFYNAITRATHEKNENKRLIDKSQKLESIVETMKERGESDEYIADILETLTPPEREILDKVKTRIKTLSSAVLALDDTVFLLQMFLYHNSLIKK